MITGERERESKKVNINKTEERGIERKKKSGPEKDRARNKQRQEEKAQYTKKDKGDILKDRK